MLAGCSVSAVAIGFVLASPVLAAPFSLAPSAVGNVVDAGSSRRAVGVRPLSGGVIAYNWAPFEPEYREAVLEYPLASVDLNSVSNLRLGGSAFMYTPFQSGSRPLEVIVRTGDGQVTVGDFVGSSNHPQVLLRTPLGSYNPSTTDRLDFNVDLTPILPALRTTTPGHLNLIIRHPHQGTHSYGATRLSDAQPPLLLFDGAEAPAVTAPASLGRPDEPAPPSEKSLTMVSLLGDYVGGGRTRTYDFTEAGASLTLSGGRQSASMTFNAPGGDYGSLTLGVGSRGGELAVGEYAYATRFGSEAGAASLDFSFRSAGSNSLTGSFVIHDIGFDDRNRMTRLAADIEQHSGDRAAASYLQLRWNTTVPEPALGAIALLPMLGLGRRRHAQP